jgi:Zn-dependent alcohol dehydrogenase
MLAAVCYDFDQPLVVEEVELGPPRPDEVLVRVVAAAICHSDIHAINGEWGGILPVVVGHEAAGIVEAVGEAVTRVRVGDPVVVSLLRSCGVCLGCTTGAPHMCEGEYRLNTDSPLRNKAGVSLRHGIRTAAFAERTVVHQTQLVVAPSDLPLDSAALLACGVITGLGAVVNTAKVRPGQSVAVIGVGGVGINSVQGARLAGAYPIIALDVLEEKLARAEEFGATHGLHAGAGDLVEQVRAINHGRLLDYVFVTVGSAQAAATAFQLVGPQGTVVQVGIPPSDAVLPLQLRDIPGSERKLIGSFMGSTRLSVDVPRLFDLYKTGRLKLDELVSARYPLTQINEAIAAAASGQGYRHVIMFD